MVGNNGEPIRIKLSGMMITHDVEVLPDPWDTCEWTCRRCDYVGECPQCDLPDDIKRQLLDD